MRPFGSLRTRLAALIFLAVAVPVVVVALVSVRVTRDADVVVSPLVSSEGGTRGLLATDLQTVDEEVLGPLRPLLPGPFG